MYFFPNSSFSDNWFSERCHLPPTAPPPTVLCMHINAQQLCGQQIEITYGNVSIKSPENFKQFAMSQAFILRRLHCVHKSLRKYRFPDFVVKLTSKGPPFLSYVIYRLLRKLIQRTKTFGQFYKEKGQRRLASFRHVSRVIIKIALKQPLISFYSLQADVTRENVCRQTSKLGFRPLA